MGGQQDLPFFAIKLQHGVAPLLMWLLGAVSASRRGTIMAHGGRSTRTTHIAGCRVPLLRGVRHCLATGSPQQVGCASLLQPSHLAPAALA